MKIKLGTISVCLMLVVSMWVSIVSAQSTPMPEPPAAGEAFIIYGDIVQVVGNVIVVDTGDEELAINVMDETIVVGELAVGASSITVEGTINGDGSHDAVQVIIDDRYELCTILFVGDCFAYIEGVVVEFSDELLVVESRGDEFSFTMYPSTPVDGTLAVGTQVGVVGVPKIVDNTYVVDQAFDIRVLGSVPVPTQEPCASNCSDPSPLIKGVVVELNNDLVVVDTGSDQFTFPIDQNTPIEGSLTEGVQVDVLANWMMVDNNYVLDEIVLIWVSDAESTPTPTPTLTSQPESCVSDCGEVPESGSEPLGIVPLAVDLNQTETAATTTPISLIIFLSITMSCAIGMVIVKQD